MEKQEFNLSENVYDIGVAPRYSDETEIIYAFKVKEFIRLRNIKEIQFLNYLLEYPELLREKIPERIKEINENKLTGEKFA